MKVEIVKLSGDINTPRYQTTQSAGFDLQADTFKKVSLVYFNPTSETDLQDVNQQELLANDGVFILRPGVRVLIGTGIKVSLPQGFEMDIRPRSGLALKNGITVLNAPGTIDADYRDEIGIILFNSSAMPFKIKRGDRIAQGVILAVERVRWDIVDTLNSTDRSGGFGHTGV